MVVRGKKTKTDPFALAALALAGVFSVSVGAWAGDATAVGQRSTGLRLVTGFGDAVSPGGPMASCLGLGAAEIGLTRCLSRGGGLAADTPDTAARVGLSYGFGGWLSVDAGLGFSTGMRNADAGLGVSSALSSGWDRGDPGGSLGTERLIGSVSAFVDLTAATGLQLQGVRPYVGANLSVGHVSTPGGLLRDGAGGAVPVQPMSGSGVAWGAAAGSNVTLDQGLSLNFAYRYTGQDSTGPLDHGGALGYGTGGGAVPGRAIREDGDHGMSIGLRLKF